MYDNWHETCPQRVGLAEGIPCGTLPHPWKNNLKIQYLWKCYMQIDIDISLLLLSITYDVAMETFKRYPKYLNLLLGQ